MPTIKAIVLTHTIDLEKCGVLDSFTHEGTRYVLLQDELLLCLLDCLADSTPVYGIDAHAHDVAYDYIERGCITPVRVLTK